MTVHEHLLDTWYRPRLNLLGVLLAPLALIFALLVGARRAFYRRGRLRTEQVAAPVVVVGNITVGGTGKTPLVLALARALRERGWRPGIVSRGYHGAGALPRSVGSDDDPRVVGDEPVLLATSGCPVWIGHDRVGAARGLLSTHRDIDVILADDGLQHYALAREVEIAVIDGKRAFGNGWMLPAGPLREPIGRLADVTAIVWNEAPAQETPVDVEWVMRLEGETFRNFVHPARHAIASDFAGLRVHAVAGIGNPDRFFERLRRLGLDPVCHAFPDHHPFSRADLTLIGADAIVMTEKDAVKCRSFADGRMWVLPVSAAIPPALIELVEEKIRGSQVARNPRLSDYQGSAHLR